VLVLFTTRRRKKKLNKNVNFSYWLLPYILPLFSLTAAEQRENQFSFIANSSHFMLRVLTMMMMMMMMINTDERLDLCE
jgi:hypothetical protein